MMMIQQQGVLHSSTDHNGRVNLYKINNMLQLIIWYICTHCTIIRLRKKLVTKQSCLTMIERYTVPVK